MIHVLYNLGIHFYTFAIRIASIWNPKARLWVRGRKNWRISLRKAVSENEATIWMHVASLGEFEQGKPVLEKIRERYPDHKVILSFFSPSGYEIQKDYVLADYVCYLPADTRGNAKEWADLLRPELSFFVKYDIWANHILATKSIGSKLVLISALMEDDSKFLKGFMAPVFKKALNSFDQIHAQNQETSSLLKRHLSGPNIQVSGDTRIDRVSELPSRAKEIPEVRDWIGDRFCIVAGSTYDEDVDILFEARQIIGDKGLCWIVAPHEINAGKIARLCDNDPKMTQMSDGFPAQTESDWLWIDNVGKLNRLYRYADFVHIGGGFGAGIHNIQEPASYGNVISFGPNYKRFIEAMDLVQIGSSFVIQSKDDFIKLIGRFRKDKDGKQKSARLASDYIATKSGATKLIMDTLPSLGKVKL